MPNINWDRVRELVDSGASDEELNQVMPPQPGDDPAQRRMAREDALLHADSMPPGDLPDKPIGRAIMDAAFERQGGVRAVPTGGMSDRSMEAGLSVLFERAAKGDPQARYKSPDESWSTAKDRWDRSR
jgi:hypothetical protein